MAAEIPEIQAKMQSLSEEYQKLQQELQGTIQSREKLTAQRTENLNVQTEFDRLKEGENIYKLVGPVLLKQDKIEAEGTVKGRLEFIGKEIDRTEKQIKEVQEKLEKKKAEIIQIQAAVQSASQGQGQGRGQPGQVAAQG